MKFERPTEALVSWSFLLLQGSNEPNLFTFERGIRNTEIDEKLIMIMFKMLSKKKDQQTITNKPTFRKALQIPQLDL